MKLLYIFPGSWSQNPPTCEAKRCRALEIEDPHLRVLSLNNSYRGEASFLCPFGYQLDGPDRMQCGADGEWSPMRVPLCKAVECYPPLSPENGRLLDSGQHLVGHTVQYACEEGFVLIGEPIIRCTENGLWSHPTPFCKRACRFPGDPRHGRVSPVKFMYEIGDRVMVTCEAGFVNAGRAMLQCTEEGIWSDNVPTCLSYLSSN